MAASQSWLLIGALSVFYLWLVSQLRHRRCHELQRKYRMTERESLAKMTTDQAQEILKDLVEMEFPKLMGFSIVFALFKTYGIPSVSSFLLSTGQLASTETASKRVADTGVLILEFCLNKPSSERAIKAISRMNYLHSRYQKAGKISNDDMLYTLSVFALEPVRWVQRFEWRALNHMEVCASGTFWKAMGDAMEISYADLPSNNQGWEDGLHWLREVEVWSENYEIKNMVPDKSNHKLASDHLDLVFLNVPPWLSVTFHKITSILVGERVQRAMMLPVPSATFKAVFIGFMNARKFALRYLALPRPEFMRKKYIPDATDPVTGRYNSEEYLSYPWYVKPTFKRRWGSRGLVTRLLGRKLPGDDGDRYAPEGYRFEDIGPASQKEKGAEFMHASESRLKESQRGKCPFHR